MTATELSKLLKKKKASSREITQSVLERIDRRSRDRQRAHRVARHRDRHLLPESAVVAHVLLVVGGVNDRARALEQAALEKRVGDQVVQREDVRPRAHAQDHVHAVDEEQD